MSIADKIWKARYVARNETYSTLGWARCLVDFPYPRALILAQGRSGSTLLCDLLNHHPRMECEGELLGHPIRSPQNFLEGRAVHAGMRRSAWGCKAKHFQITRVQGCTDLNAFLGKLVDSGWHVIYLQRQNIVRQTISTLVAAQTRKWAYVKGEDRPTEICLDEAKFREFLEGRIHETAVEKIGLNGIPHLHLSYERHLEYPEQHSMAIQEAHDYLGLDHVPAETRLKKSGGRGSIGVNVANVEEVESWAADMGYEHLLVNSDQ